MKLGAYILVHNEEDLIQGCIKCILPYVDELLLVNHGCTDASIMRMMEKCMGDAKVKFLDITHREPVDMGQVRTQCVNAINSEWILAVDADEYYTPEAMQTIRNFVENPGEAISARVKYHQMSWKNGYKQANFNHFPDRLYKKECIDKIVGVLPLDMLYVKKEYLDFPNKAMGDIGILEYDSENDHSIEHRKQPILDAWYYHLARTRGYNFEYNKWIKYNKAFHHEWNENELLENTKNNIWVSGNYELEKIDVPSYVPQKNIKEPKVSVIIPCYNYGQYLEKAIWSCVTQTVRPHEIIVVDDASTDNTEEVAALFINYPGFKYIKQSNSGPAVARNNGAELSTGDFLIFLDADDYLEPTYIEKTLKKWQETDADVIITDMHQFGEIDHYHEYPDYTSELMHQGQIAPSTCVLVDRHVWERAKFDPTAHYDDWNWYLTMDHAGARFANVHEFLFNYNRKLDSRISILDEKQEMGFQQLKERWNIQR